MYLRQILKSTGINKDRNIVHKSNYRLLNWMRRPIEEIVCRVMNIDMRYSYTLGISSEFLVVLKKLNNEQMGVALLTKSLPVFSIAKANESAQLNRVDGEADFWRVTKVTACARM